jgi:membrane-associated phospholipid phosphatase
MTASRVDSRSVMAIVALLLSIVGVVLLAITLPEGASVADRLDPAWRQAVGGPFTAAIDAFNLAGTLPVWVALVFLLVALVWRRRSLAVEIVTTAVLVEAAATLVRVIVDRPRPMPTAATELLVASGFPSGHVARTVVFMAAMFLAVPWAGRHPRAWLLLGWLAVAGMALSRVAVGAHYATDTIGGVLLGGAVVAAWAWWRSGRAELGQEGGAE